MEQPYFAPTVEESYYRLLAHIPGMVYRCRAEKVVESDGGLHIEYVRRLTYTDLPGTTKWGIRFMVLTLF